MSHDLTQFERGAPFTGNPIEAIASLQERLAQLQLAQLVHKRRAIVLVEGWEGAGKKAALKLLSASWDPCHVATHCLAGERDDERHWLARYWEWLPPAGNCSLFFKSWYRQAVEARLTGDLDDKAWARATDEINEFESQQRDHGTLLIKLFFHLTREEQGHRLRERREDPWRRWLCGPNEVDSLINRERHQVAWSAALSQTDTRWAPWRIVDAGDKHSAQVTALSAIIEAFEKAMPAEPPVEQDKIVQFPQPKSA